MVYIIDVYVLHIIIAHAFYIIMYSAFFFIFFVIVANIIPLIEYTGK